MGSQDSFFEALGGETPIGFFTHSTTLSHGVDVVGNQVGVIGRCGGPDHGDGVQGFGNGDFSGVAGFGGNVDLGQTPGTGVFGLGGTAAETFGGGGAPGVRGIGGGGPNTSPSNAVGVYGQGGTQSPGVVGQAGSSPADGVQGFGSGNFSGVAGFGGGDVGTGVFGIGGGTNGPGVRGIGAGGPNTGPTNVAGVYGQAGPGDSDGVQGAGAGSLGAGVRGISSIVDGNGVIGEADNGLNTFGVWGRSKFGFAGFFDGDVHVNGALQVTGAKVAVVRLPDGSHRRVYCTESPESWFEDFGVGQLANGLAQVQLDPDFVSIVNSDSYHVFITEYDGNNGLYVTKRTSKGFSVIANNSKEVSGSFSYRVVAKRKDFGGQRLERAKVPTAKLRATESRAATVRVAAAPAKPARPRQ